MKIQRRVGWWEGTLWDAAEGEKEMAGKRVWKIEKLERNNENKRRKWNKKFLLDI